VALWKVPDFHGSSHFAGEHLARPVGPRGMGVPIGPSPLGWAEGARAFGPKVPIPADLKTLGSGLRDGRHPEQWRPACGSPENLLTRSPYSS
jgi:hypothetical protein